MCGIGGIVRFNDQPLAPARLKAMLAQLRHRGPDGEGLLSAGRCELVHTRLSIIDPARGQQPMQIPARGDDAPLAVAFNGEIYNHRDLRRQLESLGHRFQTDHCDTEVLLHGYRAWGDALPDRLLGMFAFGIWDARAARLFLCRDRAGKKPLYMRNAPGELIFGSEVATIVASLPASGTRTAAIPGISSVALLDFLELGYTGLRSMVEGIEELPPAHWMSVDATGRATVQRYWHPPTATEFDTSQQLFKTIDAAVRFRLEADAPLGCFLSGGIDSSIVAALAHSALQQRNAGPLQTFSVAMPEADYDESPHARQVALHLGTRHTELAAQSGPDLMTDLRNLTAAGGEPTADSSILPTYWLSRATRRHVAVALSGDGGDELFAGYDRYRAMRLLAAHSPWLRQIPGALLNSPNPLSRRARFRRLAAAARHKTQAGRYRSMVHLFSPRQIAALWPAATGLPRETHAGLLPGWRDDSDPARAAMNWDFEHYLPFELLRKVDRASMSVALEVRCPLLDTTVCELAMRLPGNVLTPGGRPKGLLRALAAELLPPDIARRPKRGFAVPIGRWFRTSLRPALRATLLGGALDSLGFHRPEVERLEHEHGEGRADHTHRLFALLSLAIWREWLNSPKPPPDMRAQ